MRIAIVVAAIVACAGVARADHMPNTVSLGVPALFERGLAVEGERDLPEQYLSIAGALAMRASAGGDYGSFGAAVGVEGRYWILRRAIWSARPRGDAIGWYVGGRLDLAHTRLTMGGERIGAERQLAIGLLTGYRFAPWRGLEVRPYTGIAWRREWDPDGRLPPWSRGGLVLGFALGWSW